MNGRVLYFEEATPNQFIFKQELIDKELINRRCNQFFRQRGFKIKTFRDVVKGGFTKKAKHENNI